MKYPIGIQTFEQVIGEGYVYVDKTEMIYSLVSEGKVYFLSRPRRFGKSLLLSTLESYFLGEKELFKNLAIEKLEKEWKRYAVFHIDFNGVNFTQQNALAQRIEEYLRVWESQYSIESHHEIGLGMRFAKILEIAHIQTGLGCVVLVDEYDKPLLDVMDTDLITEVDGNKMTIEECNRETLKSFYSTFKVADKDLRFVFLTGVTKFSQISVFSGFNQPDDISIDVKYDTLCGITKKEIDRYFLSSIAELAGANEITVEEMKEELRMQYDGYHFSKRMADVFNPFSFLSALKKNDLGDYWFSTATPTYLVKLLNQSNENLNELVGQYYSASQFVDYKADNQMPLPMLYQSGYLTIKGYDKELRTYLLDFPNNEVKTGFVSLVAGNYFKKSNVEGFVFSIVKALQQADLDQLKDDMTAFFASIPYDMRRRGGERKEQEKDFHYTFFLIMRLVSSFLVYTEKRQSQGRVDCVIETKNYIYIFEFKLDGTAVEALQQINDKGYAKEYITDKRQLYKIGCAFSSKTGTIYDWRVE